MNTEPLALGCSHTAGIGLEPDDCYVNVLSRILGRPIINCAQPGGNNDHVEQRLVAALRAGRPEFVIAQWPNPIRKTIWKNGRPNNENIATASPVFQQLVALGEENFYNPWLQSIVTCNTLCNLANVPIINIMIENIDQKWNNVLVDHNIILHVDQKLPGLTWLMDSKAMDNMHHSATCHRQWAERLLGLINEHTTR